MTLVGGKRADEVNRLMERSDRDPAYENQAMRLRQVLLLVGRSGLSDQQVHDLACKVFEFGETSWLKEFLPDEYEYITSAHVVRKCRWK